MSQNLRNNKVLNCKNWHYLNRSERKVIDQIPERFRFMFAEKLPDFFLITFFVYLAMVIIYRKYQPI